jgi:hypothetical protein
MKNYEVHIESLFGKAEDFTKTTLELLKLKAIDSSADFVSFLVVKLVLFSFICLFIIIANIGVALWIGDLLGKSYYGFFLLAACYALILSLLPSYLYQWVKVPISNFIIAQLLKKSSS